MTKQEMYIQYAGLAMQAWIVAHPQTKDNEPRMVAELAFTYARCMIKEYEQRMQWMDAPVKALPETPEVFAHWRSKTTIEPVPFSDSMWPPTNGEPNAKTETDEISQTP